MIYQIKISIYIYIYMLIEMINYFHWICSSWVRHSYFKTL